MLLSRVAVPRQTAPVRCGRKSRAFPSRGRRSGAARRARRAACRRGRDRGRRGPRPRSRRCREARRCGRCTPEVARGAPLGRAVLQAFLDDEPRRRHGDRGAVGAGHRRDSRQQGDRDGRGVRFREVDASHARDDRRRPADDVRPSPGRFSKRLGAGSMTASCAACCGAERRRADAEVAPRRGFAPNTPSPHSTLVEVDLEDAPLAEDRLELPGEDQLLRLAQEIALAAQEQVLRQLLGDGRAADDLRRRRSRAVGRGLRRAPLRALRRLLGDLFGALVLRPRPSRARPTRRRCAR